MLKKWFFLLLISAMMLTGCWSSKEITDLMIVTGIGIDKDAESGNYVATVQILNPGEIASQTKTERLEVTTYQTTGKSIHEAMRRLSTDVPRRMYLSHIQLVIFGEELAREGIGKALDYISRNYEFRTDFFILVSKNGQAKDVLNVLTPTESTPSVSLYSSIHVSEKIWAPTKGVQLDEFLSTLLKDGKHPVLTGVEVIGDKDEGGKVSGLGQIKPVAKIGITGFAGFKKDRLVGWLNERESKGYNYLINNIQSTVGSVPCGDDHYFSVEVMKMNSNVMASFKNNQPSITIKLEIEADLGEVQCDMDIAKPETLEKMKSMAKEQVVQLLEETIARAKNDIKSDIFGFGEVFHRQHPKQWRKLKANWDDTFQSLKVDYKINYRINRFGTITEPVSKDRGN
ncbi:Ger(x)C family spore germination protein [Pseudoneobacillus sp. C159]